MTDRNYTLEDLQENPSFLRWVKGEAGTNEKKYWDTWVKTREENRKLAQTALTKVAGFSFDSTANPDAKQAWHRLNKRLDEEYSSSYRNISGHQKSRHSKLRWSYKMVAGILIILTSGLTFYFGYLDVYNQEQDMPAMVEQEISTDFGERKNIKLADGSFITLNANSELVYAKDPLHPTNIKIHLQGEAYFSVTRRENPEEYPFRVHTEDGTVKVLGTEFAISTRDNKSQVVLEDGRVEVSLNNKMKDTSDQAVLRPSQLAEFVNDTLVIRQVNTEVYTSWRTTKLVFDRTPLPDVLKRIEHTFGVDVKVRNSSLHDRTLSGTIQNAEMSVILSTLSKVISAPIEIQGQTVYVGKS